MSGVVDEETEAFPVVFDVDFAEVADNILGVGECLDKFIGEVVLFEEFDGGWIVAFDFFGKSD